MVLGFQSDKASMRRFRHSHLVSQELSQSYVTRLYFPYDLSSCFASGHGIRISISCRLCFELSHAIESVRLWSATRPICRVNKERLVGQIQQNAGPSPRLGHSPRPASQTTTPGQSCAHDALSLVSFRANDHCGRMPCTGGMLWPYG